MKRALRPLFTLIAATVLVFASVAPASAALPDWMEFWKDDEYEFHGGYYDPPRETHELINAVDQNGDPFSFEDHAGQTIFVYFGYTNCPDACPATVAEWREVKAVLGEDADNVVFAMITVDPERDTPDRLAEWLGFWDSSFLGISMSRADTDTVLTAWGVTATKVESGSASGYTMNHDVSTYVIGPDGQLRLTYPLGFDPEDIAEDIQHLQSGD
jgi:protein SCO1/2